MTSLPAPIPPARSGQELTPPAAAPAEATDRRGTQTLHELTHGDDPIDEMVVATVDLQGRLVGSAVSPEHFADEVLPQGLGACTYLHAVDVDMRTDDGFPHTPWHGGFGDLRLRPDLTSLRRAPWRRSCGVVLADAYWPDGTVVDVSPRAILRRQLDVLREAGQQALVGTELEFLAFRESYDRAARRSWAGLTPASRYNIDYALFGTEGLDDLTRRIRLAMREAGIAVESARGEVHPGQYEIVFRYAEALAACDIHALYKITAKRIAAAGGQALTFMAKYDQGEGNSCHIHLSLRDATSAEPVFAATPDQNTAAPDQHDAPGDGAGAGAGTGRPPHRPGRPARTDTVGMSPLMCSFVAGQLACLADFTLLFAPNVNSYKRLAPGAFAPTGISWGRDNRTCAVRVVGAGAGLRIEHRVPGGDANPYLAVAGILAAGLYGVRHGLELEPGRVGNAFTMPGLPPLPTTLRAAVDRWRSSPVARAAFGERVVAHLAHAGEVELTGYERTVTDWERQRGFERS
ncbi:glutamine synthetase family protein [Frankia sp. Ag45/Mut15]|uniref:Glutamine synthetase family protein n=1 Tax=Frankia umida TaxID=573489 RepID=A0ABT0JRQ9_9ACTN|nr:glutamine synthetase family protein [Frankia umida]MCK9874220.1 glutamine synthetase family protein [Frankia umida]